MAEFEPRPPRPPQQGKPEQGGQAQDPITDRLRQADQATQKLGGRRLLPRLPVPRRLRKSYDKLPQDVRYRIQVIGGFAQTGLVIIFATLGIALLFKALTSATVFEPKNGKQVLEGIKDPKDLSYSVETIRVKPIDGSLLRIDTVRGFQVEPERKKLLGLISGVGVSPFRVAYDGKLFYLKYKNADITPLNKKLSEDDIRPVYASDLVPVAGRILNSKATVDRQRGWLITWKPNSKILLRLLSANLLELEDKDIEAIRKGDFKVRYARATVLRSPRRLYQLDTTIRVNGAQLRILANYRQQDQGRISELDLSERPTLDVN